MQFVVIQKINKVFCLTFMKVVQRSLLHNCIVTREFFIFNLNRLRFVTERTKMLKSIKIYDFHEFLQQLFYLFTTRNAF